jgi:hypothetical protein
MLRKVYLQHVDKDVLLCNHSMCYLTSSASHTNDCLLTEHMHLAVQLWLAARHKLLWLPGVPVTVVLAMCTDINQLAHRKSHR